MKCKILHTSPGRVRVHMMQNRLTLEQADILEYYLLSIPGITSAKVYDRTCDAVIVYTANRQTVLDALGAFSYERHAGFVPEQTGRALNRECEERLIMTILSRMAMKVLLPNPLHTAVTWYKAASHIKKGLSALLHGKVDVALLDATAITVSLLRNDHDTASSIMFLLKAGEILEDWTHKKSVDDLARAMSLNIDQVWLKVDGKEVSVPVDRVSVGDYVVVRTGSMIPLDGTIVEGEAMINQASMTGEPLPVAKRLGSYVYAGTVVEEGECVICVDKCSGSGRYDRIVRMIKESEKLKSSTEVQANHLADKLVPYSLAATAFTWSVTRNTTKALSILMVDFSVDLNNRNLEHAVITQGYDYTTESMVMTDTLGHGTYVTQMIAGDGDEGMMQGIAPKATIAPLCCFSERTTDRKLLIRAIEEAADPEKFDCDIINMSWGDGNNSEIMKAALQKAYDAGVILVAAAGNVQTGMPQGTVCYPAAWDTVIGVGSVDAEKNISAFSQQTEAVDVCAPGQAIPFCSLYNVQTTQNGTSFAAPCVSAMLAMLLETAPEMTPAFAENLLKEYAQDLGTTGRDDLYGYGFVDFSNLLTVDTWGVDRGAGGGGLWLPGEKTGTVYLTAYDNDGKMCSLQTVKLKSGGLWTYFLLKQEDETTVKAFFLSDKYLPQRIPFSS